MQYDLDDLRQSLDNIDDALLLLLAERFRVTNKVGLYKRANNLPPIDPAREAEIFTRIATKATRLGLSPEFAQKLFKSILEESVANHKSLQ